VLLAAGAASVHGLAARDEIIVNTCFHRARQSFEFTIGAGRILTIGSVADSAAG
jgi:hypothetical protein